jgi:hypothetical protein
VAFSLYTGIMTDSFIRLTLLNEPTGARFDYFTGLAIIIAVAGVAQW